MFILSNGNLFFYFFHNSQFLLKYNSDDERARVAVGLVTSVHNKVRDQIMASARTKTNSTPCVGK